MANKLAQEIERLLSDAVGEFIAKATLKKNCEFIGITPETLTAGELPALAEGINKSISFFSGKDVAAALAEKIKDIKV